MGTLDNATNENTIKRTVIEVERVRDGKITFPDTMSLQELDKVVHSRIEFENKTVAINAEIEAPIIFEAAYALHEVLTEKFGWANMVDTPGFFGDSPPVMLSVPIGRHEHVQVPLGRFKLPGVDGYLETSITPKKRGGPLFFFIQGEVKRRDEERVNELVTAVQERVRSHSIYRGKAIGIQLTENDEPRLIPELRFIDLDPSVEVELVLPELTEKAVTANIFTVIERTDEVRKRGIPLKRGILLAGPFGTGKTMVAHTTAQKAIRHGWTYLVCENPQELADIIRLARTYQPAVVFCEDIDRILRGDNRSMGVDEILNVIDGVESKGTELMVVLTTNELDKVTTALLRPGRLDAVIHIGPPDAAAAERLMRQYGRGMVAPDERLTKAGKELAGNIPAIIREAVEKSKLYAIGASNDGDNLILTDDSIFAAAVEMREHRALLEPKTEDLRSETVKAAEILAGAAREHGTVLFPVRPTGEDAGEPDGATHDLVFVRAETVSDDIPGARN